MRIISKIKDSLRRFDDFHKQGLIDLVFDYSTDDKDNLINCNKCGHKLGLWRMVYLASKVKRGDFYHVRCKNCMCVNVILRRLKNEC